MKRALLLLPVFLFAACASKDGFIDNKVQMCGPGSEIGIEAGWDTQSSREAQFDERMTLLVRVSNNSDEDVTVKAIRADPMTLDRDTMYEIERGSRDFTQLIKEGDASTFEIPMLSRRRMQDRSGGRGVRASGVDLAVTVLLTSDESYRCRFRLPLGF
jgi:hypothetical protein